MVIWAITYIDELRLVLLGHTPVLHRLYAQPHSRCDVEVVGVGEAAVKVRHRIDLMTFQLSIRRKLIFTNSIWQGQCALSFLSVNINAVRHSLLREGLCVLLSDLVFRNSWEDYLYEEQHGKAAIKKIQKMLFCKY